MRKLLIVDDSSDLLFAMESLVSLYDFDVRTALDKKSFFRELQSFKPDIVLIDVLLNGEDGRQISKTMRDDVSNKDVTIILFSSSATFLQNFTQFGADGVIEKPFDISQLVNKIKSVELGRRRIVAKDRNG